QSRERPQHIGKLAPTAVELVDRTMIGLARANPAYRAVVEKFVQSDPDAILLVEFVGDDRDGPADKLERLAALMADLGSPGIVIRIVDAALQRDVWEVRKAGLNIMMSMKGDGKPVSFIEDCAVPLENLAEYTDSLTQVFEKHGTEGTWYAHASVGTLHVRPILDMRKDGAKKMRAIAEEACALVKKYKGAAYSGGHGRDDDGGAGCAPGRAIGAGRRGTRGRPDSLRLALSGQLGADAFTSDEMYDTLALGVSCKGCRRECPTGVDMAKMKIEFLH